MQLIQDIGSKKCRLTESVSNAQDLPKGVLGVLEGPCSDYTIATRNDNYYSKELWEKVLDSEYVKECLETKTLFGALDHPETLENLAGDAAVSCTDLWLDDAQQCLMGKFNVLPTPRGKILDALLKTGATMGVSCRGVGDVIPQSDGTNVVDADSYTFVCFDVVTQPAAAKARQKYQKLTESQKLEVKPVLDALVEAVQNCKSDSDLTSINILAERLGYKDANEFTSAVTEQLKVIDNQSNISQEDYDALMESNKTLQKDLANAYKRIKVAECSADRTTIAADLSTLRNKVGKIEKLIESYNQENNNSLQNIIKESSDLKSQNNVLQENLNDFNKLKEDYSQLQKDVEEKTQQINALLEKVNFSKSFVDKCKTVVKQLKDENKRLGDELSSSEEQIQTLNESVKQSKSEVSKLQKLNKSESKRLTEALAKVDSDKSFAHELLVEYLKQKESVFGKSNISESDLQNVKSLKDIDLMLVELNKRRQPNRSDVMAAQKNLSEVEDVAQDDSVLGMVFSTLNKK